MYTLPEISMQYGVTNKICLSAIMENKGTIVEYRYTTYVSSPLENLYSKIFFETGTFSDKIHIGLFIKKIFQ